MSSYIYFSPRRLLGWCSVLKLMSSKQQKNTHIDTQCIGCCHGHGRLAEMFEKPKLIIFNIVFKRSMNHSISIMMRRTLPYRWEGLEDQIMMLSVCQFILCVDHISRKLKVTVEDNHNGSIDHIFYAQMSAIHSDLSKCHPLQRPEVMKKLLDLFLRCINTFKQFW